MKVIFAISCAFALSACAGAASISPGQISSLLSGFAGIPSATISQQTAAEVDDIAVVAMKLAMLRAMLNGQVPTLPQGTAPTAVVVTNSAQQPVPSKVVP